MWEVSMVACCIILQLNNFKMGVTDREHLCNREKLERGENFFVCLFKKQEMSWLFLFYMFKKNKSTKDYMFQNIILILG